MAGVDAATAAEVDAALASGLWKEKKDPSTGKKYYRNTATGVATWNLAKELKKAKQASSVAPSSPVQRSSERGDMTQKERAEKQRQRAEEEVMFAAQIAELEQQKVTLEMEVARLRAPIEAEVANVRNLKRLVADKKISIDTVHREATSKRNARAAELAELTANLSKLQSAAESDVAFRESVESRHRQLLLDAMELSNDLEREQAAAERLKLSVREAEGALAVSRAELQNLRTEITQREELVRIAEDELRDMAKRKAEAIAAVAKAEATKKELEEQISRKTTLAGKVAAAARESSPVSLKRLSLEYQAKVRTLEQLSERESRAGDVAVLEQSTLKLRDVIKSAEKDAWELDQLRRVLESELSRLMTVTAASRNDCTVVTQHITELDEAIASRQ